MTTTSEAPLPGVPLGALMDEYRGRCERALTRVLPNREAAPPTLHAAMHYAVLGGGKRVRPVLVYAAGRALSADLDTLDVPACAVELIHAYSLIHDDLPAMDDDDLRRGRPTLHRAFDEATAILAGDALQTLAFDILAGTDIALEAAVRLRMVRTLADAAGAAGMVGGQAIDLAAVGQALSLTDLEDMHSRKTGALIRASVRLGALCAPECDETDLEHLDRYARAIGLAFQIRDDILDVEGETAVLGKTQGADLARNKPTYPALLGLDGAKRLAAELHERALESLSRLDGRADPLRALSAYIIGRAY